MTTDDLEKHPFYYLMEECQLEEVSEVSENIFICIPE